MCLLGCWFVRLTWKEQEARGTFRVLIDVHTSRNALVFIRPLFIMKLSAFRFVLFFLNRFACV